MVLSVRLDVVLDGPELVGERRMEFKRVVAFIVSSNSTVVFWSDVDVRRYRCTV